MAKNVRDYIPTTNGEKSPWAKNLKSAIAVKGPSVGESAGDINDVQNAAQGIIDEVNKLDAAKADYEAAVADSKKKIKAHIKLVRQHANRMKTHSGYTAAIGLALGSVSNTYDAD